MKNILTPREKFRGDRLSALINRTEEAGTAMLGRQPFAAEDGNVQMFTMKPKFDLSAFLAEKSDPERIRKYQKNRRYKETRKTAPPSEAPEASSETP